MSYRLGTLDAPSLERVLQEIRGKLLDGKLSESYWESYRKDELIRGRSYGLMNGVGTDYGAGLTLGVLDRLNGNSTPEQIEEAIEMLGAYVRDFNAQADNPDKNHLIHAIRETWPDAEKDAAALWEFALTYSNGMYIRDFYYSIPTAMYVVDQELSDVVVWMREPYPVAYGSGESPYVPEVLREMSGEAIIKELVKIAKTANKQIAKLTSYGIRNELLPKSPNLSVLVWSNGAGAWQLSDGKTASIARMASKAARDSKAKKTVMLDANEALIPVHPFLLGMIVGELDPLPLYDLSLEARERGEAIETTDKGIRKLLRRVIDQGAPGADHEETIVLSALAFERALRAKAKGGGEDMLGDLYLMRLFQLAEISGPAIAYLRPFEKWLGRKLLVKPE